jgi:uncharacterized NAD-dependent epimerase/dehydratase family protein
MVMLRHQTERMVLLAEGRLSSIGLRMVIAALLYIPDRVVAVIDSTKERSTAQEIVGFGGDTPVVHSLEEALAFNPDSLLIGITPLGGQLPESWKAVIRDAMGRGLHIASGLKQNLSLDPDLQHLARQAGVMIHDLRAVSPSHQIRAQGSWRRRAAYTILTVGTDSNTGKMTTALMIHREMMKRGMNAAFVGTGPTGILIGGRGIAIEAVASDFLEGAIEFEVDRAVNEGYEYIIVEGQSAITNCGNAAIAMGLLHGTMPDAIVLCHQPSRSEDGYGLPLPTLARSIALHEAMTGVFKPSRVTGIGLNSMDLSREELRLTEAAILKETGLVAVDPLRESAAPLVDSLMTHFSTYSRVELPQSASEIRDRTF